jgi:hypothetical protein
MPPRHFWWLCETLDGSTKRKGLSNDDRAQMLRLIDDANKGKL